MRHCLSERHFRLMLECWCSSKHLPRCQPEPVGSLTCFLFWQHLTEAYVTLLWPVQVVWAPDN